MKESDINHMIYKKNYLIYINSILFRNTLYRGATKQIGCSFFCIANIISHNFCFPSFVSFISLNPLTHKGQTIPYSAIYSLLQSKCVLC